VNRQEKKALEFRALHAGTAFVIPNPWDVGSARVLAALGFKALATTSSGFAFTLGRPDGQATLDEVVDTRPRSTRQRNLRSPSTWRTAMVPIRRVRRSPSCALPKSALSGDQSKTTIPPVTSTIFLTRQRGLFRLRRRHGGWTFHSH